jgi:hypothetical protein
MLYDNGRTIVCNGKTDAYGIDDDPKGGSGEFMVIVDGVEPGAYSYSAASHTLTVSVTIKHGANYTRQVRIRWP